MSSVPTFVRNGKCPSARDRQADAILATGEPCRGEQPKYRANAPETASVRLQLARPAVSVQVSEQEKSPAREYGHHGTSPSAIRADVRDQSVIEDGFVPISPPLEAWKPSRNLSASIQRDLIFRSLLSKLRHRLAGGSSPRQASWMQAFGNTPSALKAIAPKGSSKSSGWLAECSPQPFASADFLATRPSSQIASGAKSRQPRPDRRIGDGDRLRCWKWLRG